MRLRSDWQHILKYAWSIRLLVLAALLQGVECILPLFTDNPPFGRGLFAGFSFIITIAAFVSRIAAQKEFE